MKLRKRITAFCTAVLMSVSLASIGASASYATSYTLKRPKVPVKMMEQKPFLVLLLMVISASYTGTGTAAKDTLSVHQMDIHILQ